MDKLNKELENFIIDGKEVIVDPASEENPDYSSLTVIDMNTMEPVQVNILQESKEATKRLIDDLKGYRRIINNPPWQTFKGWLARDKDGRLYLHTNKPRRVSILGGCWDSSNYMELDSNQYPDVTYETEPKLVSITITPPLNEVE